MMKEPKVGDVIHVKATVYPDGSGLHKHSLKILIDPEFGAFYVPVSTVVHVEPRPLAVGDKVRCVLAKNSRGEIKGAYGSKIWVLFEIGDPLTCVAEDFELDDSK